MTLKEFLGYHLELRPRMQVEDVFKLLFQANYGNGHSISESAFAHLNEELSCLDYNSNGHDSLTEPVSIDTSLVRVNLRPFVLAGHSSRKLYELMETSGARQGSFDTLMAQWEDFMQLCPSCFSFDQADIACFKVPDTLPRHSALYHQLYAPAYRIVAKGAFEKAFG
jgi:hypothetical protein